MNQLKWGATLSYLSMGLGIAISLAYTPVMLRLLGQSEYGLYTLVASVVNYLSLLGFGFGSTYVRYYIRAATTGEEDDKARLNGLFLVIFSAIALASTILGAVLVLNVGAVFGSKLSAHELDTARVLTGLMAFSVTVSLPASVFSSFVMANEKFVFQRLLQIIQVIVSPVVTLLVLLLGYRSIGMASVVVGVVLVTTAVNIWFSVKKLRMRFSFRGLDGAMLREIAVFSSYIFVNIVIDQVNWNVDKFILGRVGGTVAVAVYALGAQLNTYYVSLSSAVSSVFIPRVHRLVAAADDDLELTRLFTRVGRVQFLILALAGGALVVFGRRFISVWAGANYAGAYTIALFLVIPVTIPLMQNLGIEIQRAKNLHQFRSWLYLGIAVVNVAVSIPLAQRYGGAGAAAGTAAALIVGNGLIMNIYYHKRVGLDMKYFWRAIAGFVPALVPVVITGAVIMLFADMTDLLRMAAWGLAYIGVYCVSMWFLGMNDYEHDLISRPVVRLRTRWKMTAG